MKRLLMLAGVAGMLLFFTVGCNFPNVSSPNGSEGDTSTALSHAAGDTDPVPGIDTMTTANRSSGGDTASSQEFRGVWLTYTELNKMFEGRSVEQAKQSLDKVMDNAKSYGLNAVIFHVRAKSDAYYPSTVFDAAASVKTLIGEGFDPLAYAVEAAHSRGLQLHAWINPYRVGTDSGYAKSKDIFSVNGTYYYDPASLDVQALILRGIQEIVDNYAVDGIQFDDYFYPANTDVIPASAPAAFESDEYAAYQKQGGVFSIADWRRSQVDALIASACQKVHTRNGCVFGVSPRASVSQSYSLLYADVENWTENAGYVDYICPQIYFGFENTASPFDKEMAAWAAMKRSSSVKLYIGLALYKTGWQNDEYAGNGKQEWAQHGDIIKRSVELIRTQKACAGMIFYSYTSFNPGIREVGFSQSIAEQEVNNLLAIL